MFASSSNSVISIRYLFGIRAPSPVQPERDFDGVGRSGQTRGLDSPGRHYRCPRFGAYTPTDMPVCGSCGRDNPESARFCMACASPLTAVPALGMARKTVSIVFCDVVGSTPMGDELDPETVRRGMTRVFDEM